MGIFNLGPGPSETAYNSRVFNEAMRTVLSPHKRRGLNNFLTFSRCLDGYGEFNVAKEGPRSFSGIPAHLGDAVHALGYIYGHACDWHMFYFIRRQEYNPFYRKWNPCVTDDEVFAALRKLQMLGVYGAGEFIMRRIGARNMPMRGENYGLRVKLQ